MKVVRHIASWMAPVVVTLVAPLAACGGAGQGSPENAAGVSNGGAAGAAATGGGGSSSGGSGGATGGAAGTASSGGAAGGPSGGAAGTGGVGEPSFGPVEELETGVNLPDDVATDATHVYWVEEGSYTPNYQGDGRVVRRAKSGGTIEVLASGRYSPAHVEVDDSRVYFGDSGNYWDTSKPGRIASVAKSGGTVSEITSDSVIYGLATDATTLFFFTPTQVKKVPKAGGNKATLAGALDALNDIAVDASGVYFTSSTQDGLPVSQGMGTVRRVAASGGALTLLAEAKSAGGVAVTDAYVLYGSKGSILRVSKSGGAPVTLATSSSVMNIAVDATHAYWTDCAGGSVLAVPIEGGEPVTLATGYVCPWGLGVEEHYVYFTDRGNLNGTVSDDHAGVIARIPK